MTIAADALAFDQRRVANPEARKLPSYPLFDWLRFLLAATVVLSHERVALPGPIDGGLAVAAFLALSGWLIGGILFDSRPRDLPRFFFNRATRIWLPYLATFALIYGLAAVRDGVDANWAKYAFYDLTFTHYTFTTFPRALTELPLGTTGNHFWSISVEEQFYLFAPALMFGLAGGKRLVPWLVVAAVLLAVGSRFAPIALGLVAAIVERRHGAWQARGVMQWLVPLACLLAFAALWRWPGPQLAALFAVLLVLACARTGRRGAAGLFLGAISYPVYLDHWIGGFAVNALARHLPLDQVAHQALAFVAGIAAAVVLWALIDRPVMARRAAWFTPGRGRLLGGVAYALVGIGLVGGCVIRAAGG